MAGIKENPARGERGFPNQFGELQGGRDALAKSEDSIEEQGKGSAKD